jgi:hypothetical protein
MMTLQVHCSRSYSGDYDEGCRFTVAEDKLKQNIASQKMHVERANQKLLYVIRCKENTFCYSEPATVIIVSRITSATVNLQPSS